MKKLFIIVALLSVPDKVGAMDFDYTGQYFLKACSQLTTPVRDNYNPFEAGKCAGAVETMFYFSSTFGSCIPNGATIGQTTRVIIKYLNNNPELLHQAYFDLSIKALREVWPCRKIN